MLGLSEVRETRRGHYEEDHEFFRNSVASFLERHVDDYYAMWEADGKLPRSIFEEAGHAGFIGIRLPVEYGGAGSSDARYGQVLKEECLYRGYASLAVGLAGQSDVCPPYIVRYGSGKQKAALLPSVCRGETILALAMTEPDVGSDLRAMKSYVRRTSDGRLLLNGEKQFISNGINADLFIVAARFQAADGLSLFLVPGGASGVTKSRLAKIGLHGQDTASVAFDDVVLGEESILGTVGKGLEYLKETLRLERLGIAITAVASAEAALAWTRDFALVRNVSGGTLATRQNTRFVLADCVADVVAGWAIVDRLISLSQEVPVSDVASASAKLWTSEMQSRVLDACLQLHGGFGYMQESAIGRAWADGRVTRIYGGTSEMMRTIVGSQLLQRQSVGISS